MDDIKAIVEASKAWENQDLIACYDWIVEGLKINYKNYELYLMLGQFYDLFNQDQAYLCYENALFYCDNHNDYMLIREFQDELISRNNISIKKVAIIILSYNNARMTMDCIESIRNNNDKSSYELVIVDNASTDGIQDWLTEQDDIKLIKNKTNLGFPAGCNQGIDIASLESDILLLNNDTIVPPNAIFWLRMGLYENSEIGAVGSVSNYAVNYQRVSDEFQTVEEWINFGVRNNVPNKNAYEVKSWLMGFAMLIKREALNIVGKLDERFSPGNYEDNDYSIRLIMHGYKLLMCKNSFIFHYGSKSFEKKPLEYYTLLNVNKKKLEEKWKFNYIPYSEIDLNILNLLTPEKEDFSVLEIGCKLGCTLARIKSKYPNAIVIGIENRSELYRLAQKVSNVINIDIEKSYDELDGQRFDYVVLDNSTNNCLNLKHILERMKVLLYHGGKIILVFENKESSNITQGILEYLNDIITIIKLNNMKIIDISYTKRNFQALGQEKIKDKIFQMNKIYIVICMNN